jgi:fructose/tagatose bisphosphate aldolase
MCVFRCSIAFLLLLFISPTIAQETDSPLICSATPTQSAYLVGEPIQLMIEISSAEKRPVEFTLDSVRQHNESFGKVVALYEAVRQDGSLQGIHKIGSDPYRMSVVMDITTLAGVRVETRHSAPCP